MLLNAIQRLEQRHHILLIRLLRRREPRLVHPVIDPIIHPPVRLLDLAPQRLGVQPQAAVLLIYEVVELGAEHAEDLGGLVAHDAVERLVVEDGDGEAARVGGVGLEVEVAEVGEGRVGGDGVRDDVFAGDVFVRGYEAPA